MADHALQVDGPIREYYLVGRQDTADQNAWRSGGFSVRACPGADLAADRRAGAFAQRRGEGRPPQVASSRENRCSLSVLTHAAHTLSPATSGTLCARGLQARPDSPPHSA